jgi:uncharacterized membrane protein YfcA
MTVFFAGFLALLIGIVLGMLGGGGAILTLPMLVYVVGIEPKAAIAMSLFVVGSTSVVGATLHSRAGRVQWKIGAVFGAAAMGGAFAGGRLARFVPGSALLVAFAVVMLVTAIAMLRGRSENAGETRPFALARVIALGAAVGIVSGLVGAGGGFLIVPALILFGGLAMRDAVGTSLFVIALQSFAGFAGHVAHVDLDWTLAGIVTAAAVIGTIAGASVGKKVSPDALRLGFAWLVLAMGLFMVARQLPPLVAGVAIIATIATVGLIVRKEHPQPRQEPCTTSPHFPR